MLRSVSATIARVHASEKDRTLKMKTEKNGIGVCRDISVAIRDQNYYGNDPRMVTPEALPQARTSVAEFVNTILPGTKIEHLGRTELVALTRERRPSASSMFYRAVHEAFARHYPLALRPEVFMFFVTHTVAETVKVHSEEYRHLFIGSDAKQTILVRHDGLERGNPSSPWGDVFPMFNAGLRERVPAGIMDHMLPGFSTATPESDAASMVSFMDAASPFYDYRVKTRCGIPKIRLLGTTEDWQKLKRSAAMFADTFGKHLGLYFQHLLPVLATLAEQAGGAEQDDEFWKSIYRFNSRSGAAKFNGWITAFVNYIQADGKLVQKPDSIFDWKNTNGGWGMKGLDLGCVPSHVAAVPFIWDYLGTEIRMSFLGGVLGLDDEDGYLTPALSYGIVENAK